MDMPRKRGRGVDVQGMKRLKLRSRAELWFSDDWSPGVDRLPLRSHSRALRNAFLLGHIFASGAAYRVGALTPIAALTDRANVHHVR